MFKEKISRYIEKLQAGKEYFTSRAGELFPRQENFLNDEVKTIDQVFLNVLKKRYKDGYFDDTDGERNLEPLSFVLDSANKKLTRFEKSETRRKEYKKKIGQTIFSLGSYVINRLKPGVEQLVFEYNPQIPLDMIYIATDSNNAPGRREITYIRKPTGIRYPSLPSEEANRLWSHLNETASYEPKDPQDTTDEE